MVAPSIISTPFGSIMIARPEVPFQVPTHITRFNRKLLQAYGDRDISERIVVVLAELIYIATRLQKHCRTTIKTTTWSTSTWTETAVAECPVLITMETLRLIRIEQARLMEVIGTHGEIRSGDPRMGTPYNAGLGGPDDGDWCRPRIWRTGKEEHGAFWYCESDLHFGWHFSRLILLLKDFSTHFAEEVTQAAEATEECLSLWRSLNASFYQAAEQYLLDEKNIRLTILA